MGAVRRYTVPAGDLPLGVDAAETSGALQPKTAATTPLSGFNV